MTIENRRAVVAMNIPDYPAALSAAKKAVPICNAKRGESISPHYRNSAMAQDVREITGVCADYLTAMGYLTSGMSPATKDELMHLSTLDSDVLILAAHGLNTDNGRSPGDARLGFFQAGSPASSGDGDFYLGFKCGDESNPHNCNMEDYVWSNCKLAILFSCYSAGVPSNDQPCDDSLAWRLYSMGARCVIAWQGLIYSTDVKWIPRFLDRCADGATVQEAMDYATNFTDYHSQDGVVPIRNIVVYGDATQPLLFDSANTAIARMPDPADMPRVIDISEEGYIADETDSQAINDIMQAHVPGFNPDEYVARTYPSSSDGGMCAAKPGDFAVEFRRKSGRFISDQGCTLTFRQGRAHSITTPPTNSAPAVAPKPPELTGKEFKNAKAYALKRLKKDTRGEYLTVKAMDAQPYWDIAGGAYAIRVNAVYRRQSLPETSHDEGASYYYPIGAARKTYTGPAPVKTPRPEIASVSYARYSE